MIVIVSNHYEAISDQINQNLCRGTTGLYGKGMYTNHKKMILICVANRNEVTKITFTVQIRRAEDVEETNPAKTYSNINVSYNHSQNDADSESSENAAKNKADNKPKANKKSPSRNDPCPCGSGKKYKHCCGKLK